jgi:hypothetical protein
MEILLTAGMGTITFSVIVAKPGIENDSPDRHV